MTRHRNGLSFHSLQKRILFWSNEVQTIQRATVKIYQLTHSMEKMDFLKYYPQ